MTGKLLEKAHDSLTKATDNQGWTPLHFAALIGNTPIVIQLLDCDKSVAYLRDKNDKKTALHIAASKGHKRVMKELISRCPDCCELVDRKGRNILHYVVENKRFGLEYIIQEHPWLSNILLNGKDNDGNTPLHLLAVSLSIPSHLLLDDRVDFMALNNKKQNTSDIILADDTFSMMMPGQV
ncbi:hypothetical protein M0R45_005846 [Rubus argutus]|uniref:Uncharacterized protein n=1 Tax=Rubus argutus TaxID=59490 RepID=A0AAW1YNR9_RUBAR